MDNNYKYGKMSNNIPSNSNDYEENISGNNKFIKSPIIVHKNGSYVLNCNNNKQVKNLQTELKKIECSRNIENKFIHTI